jgi:uncharacterized DUF497 family protein
MLVKILKQMQEKVQAHQYIMTVHAEIEMENDALTFSDIEHAILTGKIISSQKEHKNGRRKYVIKGYTLTGSEVIVVSQLTALSNQLIIITVFLL